MLDDSHKLYYNINEVAARYGFDASKLRYWESVFPMLKPEKRGGDRIYTSADLEILDEIVYLVEHKNTNCRPPAKLWNRTESANQNKTGYTTVGSC